MRRKPRIDSASLIVLAVGMGFVWMLLWHGLEYGALQLRPLPALMATAAIAGACVLSLRIGSRRRRRRRAATVGLRALGPGLPWVLLAIVAMHANTVLLAGLGWQLTGAPGPVDSAYRYAAQPFGRLVWPLSAILIAPLAEEIGLRGFAQGRIARRLGPVVAVTICAAVFALLHGSRLWLPYYFVGGVLLGWARIATRSIWSAVILHGASNALVVPDALFFQPLTDWMASFDAWLLLLGVLLSFAATVAALRTGGARLRAGSRLRPRRLPAAITVT